MSTTTTAPKNPNQTRHNALPQSGSRQAQRDAMHARYRATAHLFSNHADSRSRGGGRAKTHPGFSMIYPPQVWSDAGKAVVRAPQPQWSPAERRTLHHGGSI